LSSDTSLSVLGFGLADLLMTDLSRSRQLRVVDRLRIDALVRELGLISSGAVDSAGAARFGKLVGARRIVVGALSADARERVRLDGRVGDVVTGAILATAGTETTLDALLDAEKALAFAVFDQLGIVLSPAERTLVEQRPTRHLAALLAYSRGVRAEAQLDYEGARRSFREAVRLDPRFTAAETRTQGLTSTAPGADQGDLQRAGALAIAGVNAPILPQVATAADPAFRQQLLVTILLIVNLP
jgi:TolB-like protein